MLLHFSMHSHSVTIPWEDYATLRDNIQHHAEQGKPGPDYAMLHAIEQAIDDGKVFVDARRLHEELLRGWYILAESESKEIAVGNRTIAIMIGLPDRPTTRHTVPVFEMGRAVGGYLCNLFEHTFAALLSFTTDAPMGAQLVVRRLSHEQSKPGANVLGRPQVLSVVE